MEKYYIGDIVAYNGVAGRVVSIGDGPGGPEYTIEFENGRVSWLWADQIECAHDWADLWITGQELLRCKRCGTIEA